MKPSEERRYMDYYDEAARTMEMPHEHTYEFLLERNKDHMNDTAITFCNQKITYGDLHTKIDEYARALYKKGVRENDVVALSLANTPEAIFLEYAVNKLGAVCCLINPTFNAYRMKRDLEISQPKFFIGINDSYRNFKDASKDMEIYPILFSAVQAIKNRKLDILYGAKQLMSRNVILDRQHSLNYVLKDGKDFDAKFASSYSYPKLSDIMFTGGSSGLHKGVDLDSNGINCVVKSLDYVTDLKPGEKFLGNLPQFMAFGKLSIHYALCKNLDLNLTMKVFPGDFIDELMRLEPVGTFASPIHWELFIDNPKLKNADLSFLRMPVSGGEQLKSDVEIKVNKILKECGCKDTLWNGLGCTEMWAPVSVKRGSLNTVGSIGTPIPCVDCKIVSEDGELGYNQKGTLHLAGLSMMLGYHNNMEETNKVIYTDENGRRWFNTGDCAILDETGELKFVGRDKRCFVSGIENIFPEQVEDLLCTISGVNSAVVTSIPDEKAQYLPKYHLFVDENCNEEIIKVKAEKLIKDTLGEFALPGYYEFHYEKVAITANGKTDTKKYQLEDEENLKAKVKTI